MTASLRPSASSFVVCSSATGSRSRSSSRIVVNGLAALVDDAPALRLDNDAAIAEDPWADIIPPLINGKHTPNLRPNGFRGPGEDPFAVQTEECTVRLEEEPFLALTELSSSSSTVVVEEVEQQSKSDFRLFPRRKVFPREEPWLLESICLREQALQPGRDMAVEIFINSSDCTMQRIAIVENKKLVQLLLEPVNSSFQVGDVYLGVVKRLLPGMNGIFVDIGTPKNALLEVNMRQYPHLLASPSGSHALDDGDDEHESDSKPASLLRRIAAWRKVRKGMMMIVQVKKEALRQKGPQLTAGIALAGRYWILSPEVWATECGVSRKIIGLEKTRLKRLAKELQPPGFGLTVRSEAAGRSRDELARDLRRLIKSWEKILKRAESAVAASRRDSGPVLLQRAMRQTLRTVRDAFNNEVGRFVVDSAHTYDEVTGYLQEVAPHLSDRVELYTGKRPIFDAFQLEAEVEKSYNSRVELPNGAYLVLEETEALVSIDVNGGVAILGNSASQRDSVLGVNLDAARQIATELRLRDIGGIIVVDFIDMEEPGDERLVYEEMRKAIERDRSKVALSEISEFGLMELTRARDRPSVTSRVTISCPCCTGTGRVESVEMTLSKIERAIKRVLARRGDDPTWPAMELRLDPVTSAYLKSHGGRRVDQLASALNVVLTLKVASDLPRGHFEICDEQSS